MSMDYGIQGRVALVTAASKGLGKACAMGLAREGARLAICARGEDVLKRTAKEITATTGAEVFWCRADMASATDIQRLIEETRRHFGRIDRSRSPRRPLDLDDSPQTISVSTV
jgi:3-oxoacyl-[acyl-carrier protein] reductase